MLGLSWQEWLAVTAVGGIIGVGATKVAGLHTGTQATTGLAAMAAPVALVTGAYVAGYAARQARPVQGYPALQMK